MSRSTSPETVAALEYAKQLYATYIDGVLSWLDPSNNKAFLADQISLTLNGISIYTVAKNSPDPALKAIAADMDHANMPIGPVGRPTEQQNILNTYAYTYTKYPNAVREYLRFMWEKPQVDYWETQSNGYIAPPLPAWNDNPVWTADPKVTPFRDVLKYALDDGYSGSLSEPRRRQSWAISSSSTCSPRRAPGTSRPRPPRTTPRSGSNATTAPELSRVSPSRLGFNLFHASDG